MHYYRLMDDSSKRNNGAILTDEKDLKKFNDENYGIFWTLNEFKGGVRKKSEIIKIKTWLVDIDDGTKEEQMDLLNKSPLKASMIVETKRGYHAYWFAKDATIENYEQISLDRLVYFFNGDKNARDYCRILRVPSYNHCKDPRDKFVVKRLYFNKDLAYTEKEMLAFFSPKPLANYEVTTEQRVFETDDFWGRVNQLDCEIALARISGTECTGMETITFKRNSNGTKQIIVDGKPRGCWIDRNGMIGSSKDGGPTIAQWIKYYGFNYKQIAEMLKKYFPELEKK